MKQMSGSTCPVTVVLSRAAPRHMTDAQKGPQKFETVREGIRSCCAVTKESGAVPRVVETVRDKQV